MDRINKIMKTFEKLKQDGLQAENADQSTAMFEMFWDVIYTCRWKGFSEEDIDILFQAAKKTAKKARNPTKSTDLVLDQ